MTGKKVDKNKIIGYQKHNDMPDQFKSYYDSISEHDQKRSIMVEGITQENITEGINVNVCSENYEETNNEISNMKFKGKIVPPSRSDIMKTSKFGKFSLDHSFSSEPSFEHVLIFIYKRNYLSEEDIQVLHNAHPLYKHLHKMLLWSSKLTS